jgi:hypothetical protein
MVFRIFPTGSGFRSRSSTLRAVPVVKKVFFGGGGGVYEREAGKLRWALGRGGAQRPVFSVVNP